jgi:hypothetical protein
MVFYRNYSFKQFENGWFTNPRSNLNCSFRERQGQFLVEFQFSQNNRNLKDFISGSLNFNSWVEKFSSLRLNQSLKAFQTMHIALTILIVLQTMEVYSSSRIDQENILFMKTKTWNLEWVIS